MKKTTKSGLIVLIIFLIAVGAYTFYTIKGMGNDSKTTLSASGTYRVAEDSDSEEVVDLEDDAL